MKQSILSMMLVCACATQIPEALEPPTKQPVSEENAAKQPPSLASSTPQKTPSPAMALSVGKVTMPKTSLLVFSKPQTRRVAPKDPLGLVLHWETEKGYPTRAAFPNQWSLQQTFNSMKFLITAPDGTTTTYSTTWKDSLPKRYDYGFYYQPTLFIRVGEAGLWDARGFDGSWTGPKPSFAKEGVYKIQVEGALYFATGIPLSFTSAAVEVEVSSSAPTMASLETKAKEEREKVAPGASWVQRAVTTESGFTAGLVLEDDAGGLFIHSAESPVRFGYTLHTTRFSGDGGFVSHGSQEVGTCIAEGTLVSTEKGPALIESLQVGERLWGYDLETQEPALSTITEIQDASAERFVSFGGLTVTPEHPVFVGGRWAAAGDIAPQEKLLSLDGWVMASPLFFSEAPRRVFDIDVDTTHNFFAGGVLVHNKDRVYQAWLDDPWLFMWAPTRPIK
jgi:hypothetical protein